MLGQLASTWLIPVAIILIGAGGIAALAAWGRRLRAWRRRNRTIEPGAWWV
jgi:hypothetical protein